MKRIDTVLAKLKELYELTQKGLTAAALAEELQLGRANVSNDLNRLVLEGRAEKIKGKPTVFLPVAEAYSKVQIASLDKFAESNPSLYAAVEQAKAAILYPPKGMNIMLLGETGVGKSIFASLIHKYAVEMNIKGLAGPFVNFNCADYANNPQLLLGQLFGVKKGAYTGADMDKAGLLEQADGGILFLDEVHRLPAEGQEMFFTFMDKGVYRRLGETGCERKARVLIIIATTENPNTMLLKTFTRRIPMVITIPALRERGLEERFGLIQQFMVEESGRLGKSIKVSINSIKAFLYYECANNVGQLKSDIQLACAKAYADFLSNRKDDIKINSLDLPSYIKEGLYREIEHRQLWHKLIDINKRYCIFDKNESGLLFAEDSNTGSIYEMLDLRTAELKSQGVKGIKLEEEIERDIEDYFRKYLSKFNHKVDVTNIKHLVEQDVMQVIEEVLLLCETELGIKLDKKIYYGLAVHISNSIDRVRRNKKIVNPKLNSIRREHSQEFRVALNALKIIEKKLDISMPLDEAGFITMFLSYSYENVKHNQNNVAIMIVAHGVSTASSMADTVNSLLGTKNAIGINAPIEEEPKHVLEKIKEYINSHELKTDILFLVDMGSLTTFGREIETTFQLKTRTIPLVSTLHILEATRKSMIGYSLDEIYRETLKVNSLYDNKILDYEPDSAEKRLAIVTICTTGEGGAKAVKGLLERNLTYDKNVIDIVPLNYVGKENIYVRIRRLEKKYEIICLIGPFELEINYPQYMLSDIIDGNAIQEIQRLVNMEKTYIKMEETLDRQLKHIDGKMVLKDIKTFNRTVAEGLGVNVSTDILIGITFHIACMLDRLKEDKQIESFDGREAFIHKNLQVYKTIRNACAFLNTKYSVVISDDEICCLMKFFNNNLTKRSL